MAKIKLTTISPVHIGSGVFYQNNVDFIVDKNLTPKTIGIINDKKTIGLIGIEHVDDWVNCIQRRYDISELIHKFSPNSTIEDFTSRTMPINAVINTDDTLKEFLHDGCGHAYIPGSSIKGAIRTAILTQSVGDMDNIENAIVTKNRQGKTNVTASAVEKTLFGKDPNSDIFRFLKIGDAIFEKNVEEAIRLVMYLNITEKQSLNPQKDRKPQLVEVLKKGVSTSFNINIEDSYNQWAVENVKNNKNVFLKKLPKKMSNITSLFETINTHTLQLVDDEIDFWKDVSEVMTGADDYIQQLEAVRKEITCLHKNACILRIGHASGWNFITGGWAVNLDNFDDVVVPASRPGNNKYNNYDFPKSRRLDENSSIIGFVKLENIG